MRTRDGKGAAGDRSSALQHASVRALVGIAAGLVAFGAALLRVPSEVPWWICGVVGWDAGSAMLLALTWRIILTSGAKETRRRAGTNDPGRTMVFAMAVVASLMSLFASVLVIARAPRLPFGGLWLALALGAVALSWALTHSLYALRYAHVHYHRGEPGGLVFPGTPEPCDLDFAYFAVTLGMTFQTSDVAITETRVRRVVLVHTVVSFIYHTVVLALALNLAFGLLSPR